MSSAIGDPRRDPASRRDAPTTVFFFLAFALALGFRLALPVSFLGNWDKDTGSYKEVVAILHRGGDLYRDTVHYNYSPIWSLMLLTADAFSDAIGSSLGLAVALLLLIGDILTSFVLFWIAAARQGRRSGLRVALLFFANPVSVLISSAVLMFDNLSVLFLLLAILAARERPKRPVPVLAALSASLLIKHITWFHPLLFARRRERGGAGLAAVVVPYLVFAVSFLPYWGSLRGIRSNVLEYTGLRGIYGTDALLYLPGVPGWTPMAVFVIAVALAIYLLRNVELPRASLFLFLVILIFAPGVMPQYFVWPVALGSLYPGFGYLLYSVVASASILQIFTPGGGDVTVGPGWFGPWWAAVAWLLLEVRNLRRPGFAGAERTVGQVNRRSP